MNVARSTTERDPRWQAVLTRDRAHDGTFVYAVSTTGVYCRPSCPSRAAKPENIRFYPACEDAQNAGFRPCKRCRPNRAGLAESHHVRRKHRAARRGDRDDLDLAALDKPEEVAEADAADLDLVCRNRLRHRPAAAIGNADDVGAPLVVDPAQEQFGCRACAKRSPVELLLL